MSKAIEIKKSDLPKSFEGINPHNLYLYCKAFLANNRANTANTKTRSEVRGGGKKPFSQKGGGRARQGSIRVPHFRGGGVVFGPSKDRNYTQKINKKQKRLALMYAIFEKAQDGKLFVIDDISIPSGKTKDAKKFSDSFESKKLLIVKENIDEKTFLSFRNLPNCCLVESSELNGYIVASYQSVVIEKAVWAKLTKES